MAEDGGVTHLRVFAADGTDHATARAVFGSGWKGASA